MIALRLCLLIPSFLSLTALARAAEPCSVAEDADRTPAFDATLLKEGRFVYRTTLEGKSLGDTVIEVRREGGGYRITMSAASIQQSWEATVTSSFAPVSAHLRMRSRGEPYEMRLSYEGAKITGEERKAGGITAVSETSTGVVIDQRVDWASMMALRAPVGSSVAVQVFDASTAFSPMLGRVAAAPDASGAWGTVAARRLDYRICKRGHVENYTVLATAATPRYMLREDMPGGLVSELVRVEP